MLDAPKLKAKDKPDLASFDWEDPFRLNDQLTEEERMLRDAARAYAQEKLQPRVVKAYETEQTDPEIFREMGAMGLLGVTVPEEYGGLGASYVAYGLIAREFERVDTSFRSALGTQTTLSMTPIYLFGSDAQREAWLASMAQLFPDVTEGQRLTGVFRPGAGARPRPLLPRLLWSGFAWGHLTPRPLAVRAAISGCLLPDPRFSSTKRSTLLGCLVLLAECCIF